ncbi:MAG: DUF4272 domain-containing protein [Planctomycetota bacterium]
MSAEPGIVPGHARDPMSESLGCWIATIPRAPDLSDPYREVIHEPGVIDPSLDEQASLWATFLSSVPPESPVLGLIDQHLGRCRQIVLPKVAPWDHPGQSDWTRWAWQANAIWWTGQDRFLDPAGELLLDRHGTIAPTAQVPFPVDARQRMLRSEVELRNRSVEPVNGVPPVSGLEEANLRTPELIAQRALALFLVAVRAEAILGDHPLSVEQMRARSPLGYQALSPREREFFDSKNPDPVMAEVFIWRYEALATFQWALGIRADQKWPDERMDQADIVSPMLRLADERFVSKTQTRPTQALLDALDQTLRLWWVADNAHQEAAQQTSASPEGLPGGIEAIIIAERLAALAWMCHWPPSFLADREAVSAPATTGPKSPHTDWDRCIDTFVHALFA